MKLGAYTACLHDKPLAEALDILADLGLNSAEINSGGFLARRPPAGREICQRRRPRGVPRRMFEARRRAHRAELQRQPAAPRTRGRSTPRTSCGSIELAALLGVKRVVTMSGTARHRGRRHQARPGTSLPWDSAYLDVRTTSGTRWRCRSGRNPGARRRRRRQGRHRDAPAQHRLQPRHHEAARRPRSGATHVGAEMDPSHLFWQGIDPVAAVEDLGVAGLQRRRQGHPDQRGGPDQRGARRPVQPARRRRARAHRARRRLRR